jgi:hypothetical protein
MQFNYFDVQYTGEKLSKENKDLNFIPKGGARGGNGDSSKLGAMYRYPIDLGNYDKAHFAFFTIYQQENTKVGVGAGNTLDGQNNTAKFRFGQDNIGTGIQTTAKILEQTYNWAGAVLSNGLTPSMKEGFDRIQKTEGVEGLKVLGNAVAKEFPIGNVNGINYLNQVTRIRDSIALYMPDTLAFSYNQNYSDFSFGDLGLGMVGVSAISDIATNKPKGIKELAGQLGKNLSPFIYAGLKKTLGSTGAALFQVAANKVVNPMLELLYTSPNFREFNFDFMFYPRNEKEAKDVYSIIHLFKYHQAPEISQGTAGFFLTPPSLFDIDFYYADRKNPNLPQLASCVLTRIDVDYAPNGFAAYEENPSFDNKGFNYSTQPKVGGTGTPVATRMTLHFKETFIHTKESFGREDIGNP